MAHWQGGCLGVKMVLFEDGKSGRFPIYVVSGPANTGDPTAFVMRDGVAYWVRPGDSVEFYTVGIKHVPDIEGPPYEMVSNEDCFKFLDDVL